MLPGFMKFVCEHRFWGKTSVHLTFMNIKFGGHMN